jgi:hypothetical protein
MEMRMRYRADSSPLPDIIPLSPAYKPRALAAPIQETAPALRQLSVSTSSSSSVKSEQQSDSKIVIAERKIATNKNLKYVLNYIHINIISIHLLQNSSSDSEAEAISDASATFEDNPKYPSFAHLDPKFVEETVIFPAFPPSHQEGYATIVDLVAYDVLSEEAVGKLRDGLQYSLSRVGHGARPKKHVEYFAIEEGEDISMNYSTRQCAGVKVCEFFPIELRTPHTSVESDGHQWADRLAEQEREEALTNDAHVWKMYEMYKDDTCDQTLRSGRGVCGGRTVIRSLKPKTCMSSCECH